MQSDRIRICIHHPVVGCIICLSQMSHARIAFWNDDGEWLVGHRADTALIDGYLLIETVDRQRLAQTNQVG